MDRLKAIREIRASLKSNRPSIGSWIQIPHPSIAEIMGAAGYDWVAIDMEHGSIGRHQLPDLFRALELGNTLPLVRVAQGGSIECKEALDAGAGGVIVPMINNSKQLLAVRDACRWPPAGKRGVAFCRGNLFGAKFSEYKEEAQAPLLIAMIEHIDAVNCLDEILSVDGLDAILIGPYDLSASMGLIAGFDNPIFLDALLKIKSKSKVAGVAAGIHVVNASKPELLQRIKEGYSFLAYSLDSVMLNNAAKLTLKD